MSTVQYSTRQLFIGKKTDQAGSKTKELVSERANARASYFTNSRSATGLTHRVAITVSLFAVAIVDEVVVAVAVVDNVGCVLIAVDSIEGAVIAVAVMMVVVVAAGADRAIGTVGIVCGSGRGEVAALVRPIIFVTSK